MKKPRAKKQPLPQPDLFGEGAQFSQAPKQTSSRAPPAPSSRRGRVVTPPPLLLNVREAAARLGLSKSTLDKMRCAGKGPRYVKSTDKAVRYDPADLDAWIAARRSKDAAGAN
ncbi:helix-turn-helix domain-containing protein [Vitreimonas sp.]|uniref:helix-turn-helix transcriptional regulator n=1 Tax=Vitreimonas sp. TaxID=3069702 RepID=UPI0032C21E1C